MRGRRRSGLDSRTSPRRTRTLSKRIRTCPTSSKANTNSTTSTSNTREGPISTVSRVRLESTNSRSCFEKGGYQQQQQGGYPYPGQQQQYNQQQYGQQYDQQYNSYPAEPEQQVYVPPVKAAPIVPFTRAPIDPNAPAPVKPPTMSFKIGGAAAPALKIGGAKPASVPAVKAPTPGSSKVVTPISSKPGTPAPGVVAPKETKAAAAAKVDAAKTNDGDTLKREVEAAADEETLADLYGKDDDREYFFSSARCEAHYALTVLAGVKPHLNIVFIGHVDAGKSTMGGNILFLCGMVDKRTMEKYEKEAKEAGRESWYLSWALDSTAQEREKVSLFSGESRAISHPIQNDQGKTVEVGRAYFETEKRRYTILDAPGHKNFVPSMISGAAQADVAVLVISAREGEFETGFEKGGQTREHAMLVKTAGVSKLIVVVNKMDDPTVNWDKERCVSRHDSRQRC